MLFDISQFPIDFVFLDELQAHPENEIIYGVLEPDPELLASITELGVLNPPLVSVRANNEKVILAGNRRIMCARNLDRFFQHPMPLHSDRRAIECRLIRGLSPEDEIAILIADNQHRKKTSVMRIKEIHRLISIGREIGLKNRLGINPETLALSPDTPTSLADVHRKYGKQMRLSLPEIRQISMLWGRIERETDQELKAKALEAFNAGKYTEVKRTLNLPWNQKKTDFWHKIEKKKPRVLGTLYKDGKAPTVQSLQEEIAAKDTEIEILKSKLLVAQQKTETLDASNAHLRFENKALLTKLLVHEPNFDVKTLQNNDDRQNLGF